jgi:glutamine synthetase
MFCDILQPDGTPYPGDPRYVLKRMLAKAAEKGYTFYVGPELEFFYVRPTTTNRILDQGGYFDAPPLDGATTCAGTIFALEPHGHHRRVQPPRGGRPQHEIDMRYAEALHMADKP